MWIRNTSTYPTEEVRHIVHFTGRAFGPEVTKRLCVNVKGTSSNVRNFFAATAYFRVPSISNAPATARHLITIRLGAKLTFPMTHRYPLKTSRFPEMTFNTWQEVLVQVAAHEMKHIEQGITKRPYSELLAERAGVNALERWRKRQ